MVSQNIRKGTPEKVVLLYTKSGTLPSGIGHECRLFGKHAKTIATSCTCPGACVGALHSETSGGTSHSHTVTSTAAPHEHISPSFGSSFTATPCTIHAAGPCPASESGSHTHGIQTGDNPWSLGTTSGTAPFAHTHGDESQEPLHKTIRYVKSTTQNMRIKSLPQNATIYFSDPVACVPSGWTVDSCLVGNRFLKGVDNACSSLLVSGGSDTHTHASGGGHSHTITVPAHCHTQVRTRPSSAPPANRETISPGGPIGVAKFGHSHPFCPPLACPAPYPAISSTVSPTAACHTHGSSCIQPSYIEMAMITKASINMRQSGIPTKGIVGWLEPLACIPSCLLLTDGTSCTINTINKWLRTTLTACTNPGTTAGGGCHTHSATGHTHPSGGSATHTHSITIPSACSAATDAQPVTQTSIGTAGTHPHSFPTTWNTPTSPGIPFTTPGTPSPHSHATKGYDPAAVSVAMLQRL